MNDSMQKAVSRLEKALIAGMDEEFRDDVRTVLAALPHLGEPVAWAISYSLDGERRRSVYLHNAIGDYRDLDPNATVTPLYAAPQPQVVDLGPGIDAAAKLIEKKADDYAEQFGWNDMGHLVFGGGEQGGTRMGNYNFMMELSEELRAIKGLLPEQPITFANTGDSEAEFIADSERLNCPACGGSGHVGDVQPASAQAEQHGAGDALIQAWKAGKKQLFDLSETEGEYHRHLSSLKNAWVVMRPVLEAALRQSTSKAVVGAAFLKVLADPDITWQETDAKNFIDRVAEESGTLSARQPSAAPSVLEGWVLVPKEATPEMVDAVWESDACDYVGEHKRINSAEKAWNAMLAAAPLGVE